MCTDLLTDFLDVPVLVQVRVPSRVYKVQSDLTMYSRTSTRKADTYKLFKNSQRSRAAQIDTVRAV
jgi:hypothetical protein